MAKIIEKSITRFDGGIANDIRSKEPAKARLISHFDALSFPNRLVPHKSSESGQDTISRKIFDFVYVSGKLFGLGTVATDATMFYQNDTGSATWSATANNTTTISEDKLDGTFLIYYAKTGKIYGCSGASTVFGYDPTGSAAWVEQAVGTLTGARAVVHSKDDIMYVGYGNKIATNNNGSWTTTALTLPSRYPITALCEYGNYLAIAVRSTDNFQDVSRVFLWDRDSSVTTLSENIDWGYGDLRHLATYEGQLVGLTHLTDGIYGSSSIGSDRVIVKAYNGSVPTTILEIVGDTAPSGIQGIYGTKFQKVGNRLYFLAALTLDGTNRMGVWSIGRSSSTRPISLTLEYLPNNDTAVTSLDGFFVLGSLAYIAYDSAGAMSKTDNASTFTATSIYETLKDDFDSLSQKKKLIGVSVATKALASGGQVVVKYKMDAESSWTTIMTHSTVGDISKSAVGINTPDFNEIQFRIESTGGAEITGLYYTAEIVGKRTYE